MQILFDVNLKQKRNIPVRGQIQKQFKIFLFKVLSTFSVPATIEFLSTKRYVLQSFAVHCPKTNIETKRSPFSESTIPELKRSRRIYFLTIRESVEFSRIHQHSDDSNYNRIPCTKGFAKLDMNETICSQNFNNDPCKTLCNSVCIN